jgi:hypothetical protein
VGRAISRAHFVGSIISMQELFTAAHDMTDEKSKLTRITDVMYMEIYHDYVAKYDPVIDPLIHNYGGPHRYLIEFNDLWGISDCRYMWQSPDTGFTNAWLPMRPSLLEDSIDISADIELEPYVSLGGKERMFSALKLTKNFDDRLLSSTFSAKTAAKEAAKTQSIMEALPTIERLENATLVAQDIIYNRETVAGKSVENPIPKKLPKAMLAEVEAMMLKENTKKAGYLRFLKRSLIKDIEWLDKRPDILPNPKLWREQTKKAVLPPVPILITVNTDGTEDHLPTTSTGKKVKEKKDPVYELAVTRLLHFNSGAQQMAKTAKFMLELHRAGDRFAYSDSLDIIGATRSFREVMLTAQDVIFYENIETTARVTQVQERMVAEEEARPWRLLRLPDSMPEVDLRRAKVRKEQEEIFRKKELSLSKLLSKVQDGFDVTREVLTREGKEMIFSKTLDDMNLDQLKVIISNAKVVGRSKLKTKAALTEAIRKYLSEHPNETLRSLCGEEEDIEKPFGGELVLVQEDEESEDEDVISSTFLEPTSESAPILLIAGDNPSVENSLKCPVQECDECAEVACDQCHLTFCSALHGPHSSHSCQQLKPGHRFVNTWVAPPPDLSDAVDIINLVAHGSSAVTESLGETAPKETASSIGIEGPPSVIGTKRKFVNNGSDVVTSTETQEQEVANRIRRLVSASGPFKIENLKRELNFNCYHVEFLTKLSHELCIDISSALDVRRPTREGVMNEIISKL